jgi:hypothetical protein
MKLGWAFFALAVIVAAAYALNRGIYIGSSTDPFTMSNGVFYAKHCRYLFPSGVVLTSAGGSVGRTEAEAERDQWFCPLFQR